MLDVTIYTRAGCGLCDEGLADLHALSQTYPLRIVEVDIRSDPALEKALFDRIPVIEIGAARLEAPIDFQLLSRVVANAVPKEPFVKSSQQTGAGSPPESPEAGTRKVSGRQRQIVIALDKLVLGFSRHWVLVLTLIVGLYAGLPFAAPVAMRYGATGIGSAIYSVYSPVCHQFAFRSWFLFGDRAAYPRARAEAANESSFEQYASRETFFDGIDVSTLDADLTLAAKAFKGSPRMGWKVAFCERDVAIYMAIALFGVAFAILHRTGAKVPYLPVWAYLVIAIAPIGLDGFSQLFANPPFNGFGLAIYPIRESTPLLRTLTGGLFGVGNAWLAYPYIEESMAETRQMLTDKLTRAGILKT